MAKIAIFNAGSSNVKCSVFENNHAFNTLSLLAKAQLAQDDSTTTKLLAWLEGNTGASSLAAIGHRVVHGGEKYSKPVRISAEVLQDLEALVPLAPLHQGPCLKVVRSLQARWPQVAQFACFDTAFHATQPWVAQAMPLPRTMTEAGVRRYGFHGLSYEYIASELPRVLHEKAQGKIVIAHLGNGASLCALVNGKSVASTMGFSALDGLMMGTRSGSIDPGVVLYLLQTLKMSASEVSDLLYHQSGLLGVSGIGSDMQVLLNSTDPHAAKAIELFVYRVVCEIGAMAAAMGGIDALVFTAGIGEHAAPIRERVCLGCAWLGAVLNKQANNSGQEQLHLPSSTVQVLMLPTNEEKMIALHTQACLLGS